MCNTPLTLRLCMVTLLMMGLIGCNDEDNSTPQWHHEHDQGVADLSSQRDLAPQHDEGNSSEPISTQDAGVDSVCGDGVVDPGEECDHGSLNGQGGCTVECEYVVCNDGSSSVRFRDCSNVDVSLLDELPTKLSETGLYQDIAASEIATNVIEFEPRFALWSDGTKKRRWLLLPEGGQVDTSELEAWEYPVGTKFFKEFQKDGVRVETRISQLTANGWTAVSYAWLDDQSDAIAMRCGLNNTLGTGHDVPDAKSCIACHGGRENFALGFSAVQLEPTFRNQLVEDNVLSEPVEATLALDETSSQALGYLHANCAHCHNDWRNTSNLAPSCYTFDEEERFDLTLNSNLSNPRASQAYLTARRPLGQANDSKFLNRMSERNQSSRRPSMPPLATDVVDDEGLAKLRRFLEAL